MRRRGRSPLAARAQRAEGMRRIGILMSTAEGDGEGKLRVDAFLKELLVLGWTEGRNLRIEDRWAAGDTDRTSKFAQELVSLQPDVILGQNTPTVPPLLQATRTIPIVFIQVSEPVNAGFGRAWLIRVATSPASQLRADNERQVARDAQGDRTAGSACGIGI